MARRLYVNRNLRRSAIVIANTSHEREQIQRLGISTPVVVIPNGVNLDELSECKREEARRRFGIGPGSRTLLYLGRIHEKKGLHLLLPAFSELKRSNPDWELLVVGEFANSGYERAIMALLQSEGAHSGVRFCGQLQGELRDAAYCACDLFVLPSLSEGFSNAVIEALAFRRPVVITTECNFPEVGESKAGFIATPDVASLSATLATANKRWDELPSMGENGRSLMESSYCIGSVVDRYDAMIATLYND
jgi:glycosyltransferase involved in cell wall biosynthesis